MKFWTYHFLSFFVITSTLTADNYSLNFDGQNDYVDLGQNLLSGTGDFSISLWANSTSVQAIKYSFKNVTLMVLMGVFITV